MAVVYTHDFDIRLNGKVIQGDAEFNLDGLISYKIAPAVNLTVPESEELNNLFKMVKQISQVFGDVDQLTKILIKAK